jgi:hypothetical protein
MMIIQTHQKVGDAFRYCVVVVCHQWYYINKHHLLPDIQSLDSSALLFPPIVAIAIELVAGVITVATVISVYVIYHVTGSNNSLLA